MLLLKPHSSTPSSTISPPSQNQQPNNHHPIFLPTTKPTKSTSFQGQTEPRKTKTKTKIKIKIPQQPQIPALTTSFDQFG
jgi:hypothetical protein